MTDLQEFISKCPLVDTHSHLPREQDYRENPPDVLADLFGYYICNDLVAAGVSEKSLTRVLDSKDPDVKGRFEGIREAWERCRFTGYGRGTELMARLGYGIDEISTVSLLEAHRRFSHRDRAGERLQMLRCQAGLDHVQVDHGSWNIPLDLENPDYFFYDLSIRDFANGGFDHKELETQSGSSISDLATLRKAMSTFFSVKAPDAIAVKTQHAYDRTLAWAKADESTVENILQRKLLGRDLSPQDADILGNWAFDHAITLAVEHDLPVKIHTGYLARNGYMQIDRIRVGHLCPLLARHPRARFVLMHIASGYEHELLAMAKHYPNVYVDFCWAWTINPLIAGQFLRECLHQFPVNRVFAFGGDAMTPVAEMAYAHQARRGIADSLTQEIASDHLTEKEAMDVAGRIMHRNQYEVFKVTDRRNRLASASVQKT